MALQEEAGKCQHLAHPNIVKVYGFYRDGATLYLTMEYLYGEPLSGLIRSGNFKGMPAEPALRIINEMGKALAFAHSCGIVHCDFKPANVFLTNAGELKLIDFGIARAFQPVDAKAAVCGGTRLRLFNALTPAYASPEILQGREADPRDDIYALACTAYELLTGVHPFNYLPATKARNTGSRLAFRKGLTQKQWKALQRALAFDRAKRTPTVERFLAEINPETGLTGRRLAAGTAIVALIAGAWNVYLYSGSSLRSQTGLTTQAEGNGHFGITVSDSDSRAKPPVAKEWSNELKTAAAIPATSATAWLAGEGNQIQPSEALPTPESPRVTQLSEEVHQAQHLAALLQIAEWRMTAKNFTLPKGQSALEIYREILTLVPNHEEAHEGIARIKDHYKTEAETAKISQDWDRARVNLEKAREIDPRDQGLVEAMAELLQAKLKAETEAIARRDVEQRATDQKALRERMQREAERKQEASRRAAKRKAAEAGELTAKHPVPEKALKRQAKPRVAQGTARKETKRATVSATSSNAQRQPPEAPAREDAPAIEGQAQRRFRSFGTF
jgi:hypothetical protein